MLLECLLYGEYMTGRVFNCKCVVVFASKKFCAIDVWLLSGVEAEDVAEGVIGFDDVVVSIDEGYAVQAGCLDDAQLFLQGFRFACLLYCSGMLCICHFCLIKVFLGVGCYLEPTRASRAIQDRKSTRLNSSHSQISYAVFCLKKKQ